MFGDSSWGWGRGRGVRPEPPPSLCVRYRLSRDSMLACAAICSPVFGRAENLTERGEPWVEWKRRFGEKGL